MTCDADSDFDEATVTSDLEAGYFNEVVFKMTMQSSLTIIEIADYTQCTLNLRPVTFCHFWTLKIIRHLT